MQAKKTKNILNQPLAFAEKAGLLNEMGIQNDENLIINVKLVRMYGILIFAINSLANYSTNLTYSFFITSISCLLLICSIYFIN